MEKDIYKMDDEPSCSGKPDEKKIMDVEPSCSGEPDKKKIKMDVEPSCRGKPDKEEIKMDVEPSCSGKPDKEEIKQLFWQLTDRTKVLKEKELKPNELHKWGKFNKIRDNSKTLNHIIVTNGLNSVKNYKETLVKIFNELGYSYTIEPFNTTKNMKNKKAFSIDLKLTPPLSFYGHGSTEIEAIEMAAKQGLTFLVELA